MLTLPLCIKDGISIPSRLKMWEQSLTLLITIEPNQTVNIWHSKRLRIFGINY